jgi:anaerobic selenocysteine-containing dehydrogenase
MHGSRGMVEPASTELMSEPAIVAGIAKATVFDKARIDWDAWFGDYSLIREEIAAAYPDIFRDFNKRMWTPGGFRRPLPAAERRWNTPNRKANFIAPRSFDEDPDMTAAGEKILRLMTMRSDDQFNTTVYSADDRFRGVFGTRRVLLINPQDASRLGFKIGDRVTACTVADDGVARAVPGLRLTSYDIPSGCVAGYFPECNPLVPLWHHAEGSQVPAAKSIPIVLR